MEPSYRRLTLLALRSCIAAAAPSLALDVPNALLVPTAFSPSEDSLGAAQGGVPNLWRAPSWAEIVEAERTKKNTKP